MTAAPRWRRRPTPIHAKATISMQEYCTEKTLPLIAEHGQEVVAFNHPIGVNGDRRVPDDASRHHRQGDPGRARPASAAVWSTPSPTRAPISTARNSRSTAIRISAYGLAAFLLELGAEPTTVLATNGGKAWEEKMQALFDSSPFGKNCKVYPGKDLWHMRSLLFTDPVDFLIGNTYGKYLERDTGTPLIRIGFPIFDRHHHHRYPVWGYQGGMNVLVTILDKIFDEIDRDHQRRRRRPTISFDIIR